MVCKIMEEKSMKQFNIMKKVRTIFILCLALLLTACNLNERSTYTFSIENGDSVNITFKSKDGYSISQKDGTFIISKDNKTISQGL